MQRIYLSWQRHMCRNLQKRSGGSGLTGQHASDAFDRPSCHDPYRQLAAEEAYRACLPDGARHELFPPLVCFPVGLTSSAHSQPPRTQAVPFNGRWHAPQASSSRPWPAVPDRQTSGRRGASSRPRPRCGGFMPANAVCRATPVETSESLATRSESTLQHPESPAPGSESQ